MLRFNDISFWARKLGHLPIHLKTGINDRFIMLNGVSGNFCMHFSEIADNKNIYFSQSWSSNTKNFLLIDENNVHVYNWSRGSEVEKIGLKSLENNLDKFYNYLVTKSYKSEKDVVPIIIDTFRQFRTLTSEFQNPIEALNLLFILLASVEEGSPYKVDAGKWGISNITIPNNFEAFSERFIQSLGNITPDLNLILRHSAGSLFQEAQKEVVFFDGQLDLFGTFSGSSVTKSLIYSSIHYTPSYLARAIVENTLKALNLEELDVIKILDPACGSAEFLIEVLKQLKEKDYKGKVFIQGFDSSDTAVNTSIFLLTYEKRLVWGDKLIFNIKKVKDSLLEDWGTNNSIILMNPPFMSWEQLIDKDAREAVKVTLENNFKGKPNQSSAFFYKAIKSLADGGAMGSVIPSSFFTLDSYVSLRHEISDITNIQLIGKLGNFVFEDALTDVSIIVINKPKTSINTPTLLWTRNEKGIVHDALRELRKMQYAKEESRDKIDFSIFKPNNFPVISDSWKTISFRENILIRNLKLYLNAGKLVTISSLFNVQQGVRPGNKKVFVISKQEYKELPENERKYFVSSIDNEAIDNGIIKEQNYVWYPYDIKNGISLINSEEDLKIVVPTFYRDYLLPNKDELLQRRKIVPNWWSLSDRAPRLLPLESNIVSTEFGNSSSFAFDYQGKYIVERGYSWKAKKQFSIDDYYFYLALFSSPFFDKLLSIYSKELAGGKWYELGKMHTKEIPVPNVLDENVKSSSLYIKMVELGRRLSEGDFYVKAILDDIVSFFYPQEI
ncbi:MAG: N-6 DNA methylase [Flavobacteriales bacterium]|nr:N-6 DNA methylase [Flavobacteriales bacterium]MCA0392089.1 SAM-dependent methyltransferase [Bacteroidota bacterium]